jgi:hypothetical protein
VLPADYILWSERFAGGVAEISKKTKGEKFELWTAGGMSKGAKANLSQAGWVIHTNALSEFKSKLKR